jgi:hypothetical protein
MSLTLGRTSDDLADLAPHSWHPEISNSRYAARVAPWIDAPLVVLDQGRIWLLAPAERDPVRTADGRHVVPARPLSELRQIAAIGAQFHHIAIAHELDADGPARQLLPVLAGGPQRCSNQLARQLVGPVPTHPGVARLAAMMELSSAVSFLSAIMRDPIVFGVVGRNGPPIVGEPALWYLLTAWEW